MGLWLEELNALSPNRTESNVGLSLASFDLNDYTKAERCLSEAVVPSTFRILKAMVLLILPRLPSFRLTMVRPGEPPSCLP
jgi:hypothetical protein